MKKKKAPPPPPVVEVPAPKKRRGGTAARTPGSHRDIKEKKKLVKLSETGKNKHGKPKKTNVPDSATVAPVPPDKDPMPEHIARGQELGLNLKQIEFVEVYMTCYNGTRSYMAVYGGNYNVAGVMAHRMFQLPHVKTYLGERMKQAFARTESAQDDIIQAYTFLAYADVNELVEHRREACRYCYGTDHRYQSTPEEMRRARDEHAAKIAELKDKSGGVAFAPAFDEQGGVGFDPRREPHPDCPECYGEGRAKVHFHDTRNLSPAALALYEGAEITKDGIKIKTSSRDGAREKLAKILKVYEDASSQVNITFTAEEMEERFGRSMRIARERAAAMRAERGMAPADTEEPGNAEG